MQKVSYWNISSKLRYSVLPNAQILLTSFKTTHVSQRRLQFSLHLFWSLEGYLIVRSTHIFLWLKSAEGLGKNTKLMKAKFNKWRASVIFKWKMYSQKVQVIWYKSSGYGLHVQNIIQNVLSRYTRDFDDVDDLFYVSDANTTLHDSHKACFRWSQLAFLNLKYLEFRLYAQYIWVLFVVVHLIVHLYIITGTIIIGLISLIGFLKLLRKCIQKRN